MLSNRLFATTIIFGVYLIKVRTCSSWILADWKAHPIQIDRVRTLASLKSKLHHRMSKTWTKTVLESQRTNSVEGVETNNIQLQNSFSSINSENSNVRQDKRNLEKKSDLSFVYAASAIDDDGNNDMSTSTSDYVVVKETRGPLTSQSFAESDCWGNQPLLIRNAFQQDDVVDVGGWPTLEEIAELACDEEAESRIITHKEGEDTSYSLQLGPFEEDDIQTLFSGDTTNANMHDDEDNGDNLRWTLLVNDVDRFLPSVSDWISNSFPFLPNWRRDDGQISIADEGGAIGKHVDNYDVFLVQTSGMKEWSVGQHKIDLVEEDELLLPDLDVRILRKIETTGTKSFVLYPGDVLYLPPRVTHEGVALSDQCATLSVGCRAPSAAEMMVRVAEVMSSSLTGAAAQRYEDPDMLRSLLKHNQCKQGEITMEAKYRSKKLLQEALSEILDNEDKFDEWFGKISTESKRARYSEYPMPLTSSSEEEYDDTIDLDKDLSVWDSPETAVSAFLQGDGCFYQAEGIVFAYSSHPTSSNSDTHRLFVNGLCWEVSSSVQIDVIANERCLTLDSFLGHENGNICDNTRLLLEDLITRGLLYGSHDD